MSITWNASSALQILRTSSTSRADRALFLPPFVHLDAPGFFTLLESRDLGLESRAGAETNPDAGFIGATYRAISSHSNPEILPERTPGSPPRTWGYWSQWEGLHPGRWYAARVGHHRAGERERGEERHLHEVGVHQGLLLRGNAAPFVVCRIHARAVFQRPLGCRGDAASPAHSRCYG